MISVFDLFKIGIGPSSSHTVGPMRAALKFVTDLKDAGNLDRVDDVVVELFGSLAATGRGHGTDRAVVAGLSGFDPQTVDPEDVARVFQDASTLDRIMLDGRKAIGFTVAKNILFNTKRLPAHPNAVRFTAWRAAQSVLRRTFYSIGGGFVVEHGVNESRAVGASHCIFPFETAGELLSICERERKSIADIVRANEALTRDQDEIDRGLDRIWSAMQACVERGLKGSGILPGGLNVRRRAGELYAALLRRSESDPLIALDWVSVVALAVNEENAAGGRVVTAPTNGAAGIIPAVLHYYVRFVTDANARGVRSFLLTAAAIGAIIKQSASISGAEVGCQGEVGSASAMAAAGLAAVLGGDVRQVENAAEIALEHSLGLTCDPVGGLVQIPCIERNAIAAGKAINAARLALGGDGRHRVTLDQVVATLRETGRDMHSKYKETALGGLAVAVPAC